MLQSQVNSVIKTMVDEYEHAASILLYYFRCILHGPVPFELVRERADSLREIAPDDAAVNYLYKLVALIDQSSESSPSLHKTPCLLIVDTRDDGLTLPKIDSSDSDPEGAWISDLFRMMS
jgi:hypothetical protein